MPASMRGALLLTLGVGSAFVGSFLPPAPRTRTHGHVDRRAGGAAHGGGLQDVSEQVIFQPILQKFQQSQGDLKALLKGLLYDLEKYESKKLEAKLKALEPQAEADKEKFMSTWKELTHEIDILCKDENKMMNDLVACSGSRKKTEARVLDALQAVEVVASKTASTAAAADPAQIAADAAAAAKWKDLPGQPGISRAAFFGDLAAVRGFLRADPVAARRRDGTGWGTLHEAANHGHVEVAELLLAAGAPVNVQNDYGQTPLHIVAVNDHIAVAKVLLAAGAWPHVMDEDGVTPLNIAAAFNSIAVAKVLFAAGASPHVMDEDGKTALDWAREKGHSEMVSLLEAA